MATLSSDQKTMASEGRRALISDAKSLLSKSGLTELKTVASDARSVLVERGTTEWGTVASNSKVNAE